MLIRSPMPQKMAGRRYARKIMQRYKPQAVGDAGAIEGYGSMFKVLDDWGTVTMPGCFTASLARHAEAGTLPKMLWQHDQTQPVGAWSKVAEDDIGLPCAGNLILEVAKAQEAHALLKAGAIDGLSIGFHLIAGEEVSADEAEAEGIDVSSGFRTEDGTIILMTEVDLFEISLVTFQSCPTATVDEVRGSQNPKRRQERELLGLARALTSRARLLPTIR